MLHWKMGEFSSSESEGEEEQQENRPAPLRLDFITLYRLGLWENLALSALPGCRFRDVRRSLAADLTTILAAGITDVMVLLQPAELRRYRVPGLVEEYEKAGLGVVWRWWEDGAVPPEGELQAAVEKARAVLGAGGRLLVHCYGGLGRTCLLAAALLLSLDPSLSPGRVVALLREKRGPRAVQTVRQYNTIMEWRGPGQSSRGPSQDRSRSVSR